jgi:predicted small secreted protein
MVAAAGGALSYLPLCFARLLFASPIEGVLMIKKILFCLVTLAAVSLTACNTVEGAGKDVAATGDAIHDTAKDVKNKM